MNLPNAITVGRLLLVLPIAWLLIRRQTDLALLLIVVAALSDMADGLIARLWNQRTRFGSIADPIADKLLILSIFAALFVTNEVPGWFLLILLGRDGLIALGIAILWHRKSLPQKIQPLFSSKLAVVLQVLLAIVAVGHRYLLTDLSLTIPLAVTAAVTLFSLIRYITIWPLMMRRQLT